MQDCLSLFLEESQQTSTVYHSHDALSTSAYRSHDALSQVEELLRVHGSCAVRPPGPRPVHASGRRGLLGGGAKDATTAPGEHVEHGAAAHVWRAGHAGHIR